MARQSVWESRRPDRRNGRVSVGEPEVQPAAVWIWGGRRGHQGQGVSISGRGTQQAGWRFADDARVPGGEWGQPAERLFSREHADGAAGLQPQRRHEMVRAAQLRQRQPDRAARQPVQFPLSEAGERNQSGAGRFDDSRGGAFAPRANWILRAGAKRGGSAADDSTRPFWTLRRQYGLPVESHHSL